MLGNSFSTYCQVIGGESVFQFMRLPNSAHVAGLGGACVSNPSEDIALSFGNPALLRPIFNNSLAINQNFYLAGSSFSNVIYGWHSKKWNTTFAGGISFLNYGKMKETNIYGQVYNDVLASELNMQISACKNYKTKWRYGSTAKVVNSQLGSINSVGLMADAGIVYYDTVKQLYWGMVAKNIGFQLQKYSTQAGQEPLPFDMQIGITKKFLKAPFRINVLAHHLYQWNVRYDNPLDNINSNFFGNTDTVSKNYIADKIFRHLNFGVDVLLGKKIEFNIGYNHLQRSELALKEKLGFTGFSFGLGLHFKKIQIRYARTNYNLAGNSNTIGINMQLKESFGLGKQPGSNW
jgi:hypothetical protein